jgi:hypothetical protein
MEEPNCKICRCVDGPCFNKKEADLEAQSLDMNILVNEPLNVEYVDVDIPIFDPKINVNMVPLENLAPLKEEVDLEKVMSDIEKTANFNSAEEGLHALNNPDTIFTRLQTAFDTFKDIVGRQMTYSEMRNMMG